MIHKKENHKKCVWNEPQSTCAEVRYIIMCRKFQNFVWYVFYWFPTKSSHSAAGQKILTFQRSLHWNQWGNPQPLTQTKFGRLPPHVLAVPSLKKWFLVKHILSTYRWYPHLRLAFSIVAQDASWNVNEDFSLKKVSPIEILSIVTFSTGIAAGSYFLCYNIRYRHVQDWHHITDESQSCWRTWCNPVGLLILRMP